MCLLLYKLCDWGILTSNIKLGAWPVCNLGMGPKFGLINGNPTKIKSDFEYYGEMHR